MDGVKLDGLPLFHVLIVSTSAAIPIADRWFTEVIRPNSSEFGRILPNSAESGCPYPPLPTQAAPNPGDSFTESDCLKVQLTQIAAYVEARSDADHNRPLRNADHNLRRGAQHRRRAA